MAEPVERARAMLAQNQYLTLATADASGVPWSSTVWYAAQCSSPTMPGLTVEFVWLSRPEAQHSRNLLERPEVGISVFDSTQPAGTGDGLQFAAHAGPVPAADLDELLAVFSRASLAAGGSAWPRERVEESGGLRPYLARTDRAYLVADSTRVELPPA